MKTNIPIYEAVIETNDEGIEVMSLVDCPAVESDFLAFAKQQPDTAPTCLAFEAAAQRLLLGVVARANYPIYRNQDGMEFYLRFSPETIRQMSEKMLMDGLAASVDRQHDFELVDGVHLQQIFIKDPARGISPSGFEEIEDGSLFAVYKVHNDDIWESVQRGEFKGFSLAGHFSIKDTGESIEEELSKVLEDIAALLAVAKKKNTKNA